MFNQLRGGLRCGAAVFGVDLEGSGWVFGVPGSPLECHSAAVLGSHATVAVSSAEARSKCMCSHRCSSGGSVGRWCVVVACQQLGEGPWGG